MNGNKADYILSGLVPLHVAEFCKHDYYVWSLAAARGSLTPFSPCSDLNATMEVLKALNSETFYKVLEQLKQQLDDYPRTFDQKSLFTASPKDWAVAILKTIGRIEEVMK